MQKVAVAAAIVGAAFLVMLLLSMAQNEGCLPWQTPVGIEGSPFSATKDRYACR